MDNLLTASITSDTRTNTQTVVLVGEFDHFTSATVCASLERTAQLARDANWVIDTSGLTFVDSSVLNLLVALDHHVDGHGSVTVIPTALLTVVLEATGLADRWTGGQTAEGRPHPAVGPFSLGRIVDWCRDSGRAGVDAGVRWSTHIDH